MAERLHRLLLGVQGAEDAAGLGVGIAILGAATRQLLLHQARVLR